MSDDLFYMQDARNYVGNSMLWWAIGGKGYVCDIRKAQIYTEAEAFKPGAWRDSDQPWPKSYIDERISHHINHQECCRNPVDNRLAERK